MKKYIKLVAISIIMIISYNVQAQQVTGDATETDGTTKIGKKEDVSKSSVLNGTIRVIDNKGTKKFLQVKNGITLLTDTTTDGGIISTWQLGGTLTDSTYIDATNRIFALDGIKLLSPTLTAGEATTAAIASTASDASSHGGTGTGWTVLIRDEATGETKKLLATNLITAGRAEFSIAADGNLTVTATGLAMGTSINKISVYRNGAKLRASVDYSLTADDTITLNVSATAPNDWTTYAGDLIEVQWIY
ncbi:hypothetical protein [Polaribacter sp. Z022]|uniref:hypothetical protein n=1 Tax=Polaribacter sp. Z022 TaxID=2927125 RepID=UPI0020225701|nr:hypothetical protein [Polaribacter sp. Z022]MCL7753405.1 hypothetical protein [Polaribacter sp. Z022]